MCFNHALALQMMKLSLKLHCKHLIVLTASRHPVIDVLVQDAITQAQLQQQQAAETHAAAVGANEGRIQQLSSEVQQQQAQLDSLQRHLQSAHQQRDAAQSQLEAWQAQHAQQAPQIAELLNERQAWIQELQRERAAASSAAATAEVLKATTRVHVGYQQAAG